MKNIKRRTLIAEESEIERLNNILNMKEEYQEYKGEEGAIESLSVDFSDEKKISLVLSNGGTNNPWLDAILKDENGNELVVSEPSFDFEEEYSFEYEGNKYILLIETEVLICPQCNEGEVRYNSHNEEWAECLVKADGQVDFDHCTGEAHLQDIIDYGECENCKAAFKYDSENQKILLGQPVKIVDLVKDGIGRKVKEINGNNKASDTALNLLKGFKTVEKEIEIEELNNLFKEEFKKTIEEIPDFFLTIDEESGEVLTVVSEDNSDEILDAIYKNYGSSEEEYQLTQIITNYIFGVDKGEEKVWLESIPCFEDGGYFFLQDEFKVAIKKEYYDTLKV